MSRTIIFCVLAVAFALAGCNQYVFLEEETPPGKVPPPTSQPAPPAPDIEPG